MDREVLNVDIQCDDGRITESMMPAMEDAFDVLHSIFVYSLPEAHQIPIPQ